MGLPPLVKARERGQQAFQLVKRQHVGAVAQGLGRIGVRFDEDTVNPGGDGGAGDRGDEFRTAAGHPTRLVGLLKAVRQVHEGGRKGAHLREAPHVNDEVAVAEHGAAFRQPDLVVSRFADLVHSVLHGSWGHELPLLDVHNAPCAGGRDEKVGLAAQEGRDLKNVGHLSSHRCFVGQVNVCDDADTQLRLDAAEDLERLAVANAREGIESGAVGLAVAGLDVKGQSQLVAHALHLRGHRGRGLVIFHGARPCQNVQGLNRIVAHATCRFAGVRIVLLARLFASRGWASP